jgi:autophagy-related protein 101
VLFHRLFGLVKPKTVDVLDVTMPGVDDADMDRLVSDKVAAFWRAVEDSADKRGQARLLVLWATASSSRYVH